MSGNEPTGGEITLHGGAPMPEGASVSTRRS